MNVTIVGSGTATAKLMRTAKSDFTSTQIGICTASASGNAAQDYFADHTVDNVTYLYSIDVLTTNNNGTITFNWVSIGIEANSSSTI